MPWQSQRVQPCLISPCQQRPVRSRQGRRGENGAKDRPGGCVCPRPTPYTHWRTSKLFKGSTSSRVKDHLSLQAPSGEQHPYRDVTGSQTDPISRSKQGAMQQNQEAPAVWGTLTASLCRQLQSLWDKDPSPALLAELQLLPWATQDPQCAAMLCNGCRNNPSLSPQPALCVSQGTPSSRGPAPGRAGGQRGACRSTGAQGVHIFVFLLLPSCSRQVRSSCHEGEEPQRQGSEKTGFYSSCAAHSHSLETLSCQSYYETNQVPDSGLALPHPQESQHCTKLYLQGKQTEMASPKNPLAIQKKTFKTSVTITPSTQPAPHWLLPGLVKAQSSSPLATKRSLVILNHAATALSFPFLKRWEITNPT